MTRAETYSLFVTQSEAAQVVYRNAFLLAPSKINYRLWEKLRVNDSVIFAIKTNPLKIYAAKVTGRGLGKYDPQFDFDSAPLIIYVKELKFGEFNTLTAYSISVLAGSGDIGEIAFHRFEHECKNALINESLQIEDMFPYNCGQKISVRLAQSSEDDLFIKNLAELHPFGETFGQFSLILEKDSKPLAASIVRTGRTSIRTHRAERRIFGRNVYALKQYSTHIARLYSFDKYHRRQKDFCYLLDCILYFSANLFDQHTTFVSGVSYDFVPEVLDAGFRIEFPINPIDSLYYWHPIFSSYTGDPPSRSEVVAQYRKIRKVRERFRFWFVRARRQDISFVFDYKKWLMMDNPANNAKWRAIKAGDVILISCEGITIDGIARAGATKRESIRKYERYPLGVNLEEMEILDSTIGIGEETSKNWFRKIERGGICEVPQAFALQIIEEAKGLERRHQMWVTPNPYLLKQRRFDSRQNVVFVVQAWNLRDTVLPLIKSVCQAHGFSVTHAEDRQGQVIFEDVWILINECEAVLVDFTAKRPNVYLEFGMALVLGKPILGITQDEEDLPSDTPNLKYIKYRGDIKAHHDLSKYVPRALSDTIADFRRLAELERREVG